MARKRGSGKSYIELLVNGRRIHEHRWVMEQHLGRRLRSDEYVHHINEDRKDNRLENLQIMSAAEHNRLHYEGKYQNPNNTNAHKQCPTCKTIYKRDDPKGFRKDKTNRGGGLSRQCRSCAKQGNLKACARYRAKKKGITP